MKRFKKAILCIVLAVGTMQNLCNFAKEPVCLAPDRSTTEPNVCGVSIQPDKTGVNQPWNVGRGTVLRRCFSRLAPFQSSGVGYSLICNDAPTSQKPSIEQGVVKTLENETQNFENAIGEVDDRNPLVSHLEYYPKETLYGDSVYIRWYDENASDDLLTIKRFDWHDPRLKITVRRKDSGESYQYRIEVNDTLIKKNAQTKGKYVVTCDEMIEDLNVKTDSDYVWLAKEELLEPHKTFEQIPIVLEFPPLEDWEDPFWKKMRAEVSDKGIECNVKLEFYHKSFSFPVVIKPRNNKEMECFDDWYSNTPKDLWPKKNLWERKVSWREFEDDKSVELSPIDVKGNLYPLYLFTRFGNRKPNTPNNPRSLDEWRKLETTFQDSTVRDEITFIRKQLEYYDATTETERQRSLNELVDWLQSRPDPQRIVFIRTILERFYFEFDSAQPLQNEMRTLATKLAPDETSKANNERFSPFRYERLKKPYEEYEREKGLLPPIENKRVLEID